MERQEQTNGPAQIAAVGAMANYLREEVGVEDRLAREAATNAVRDARASLVVERIEAPRSWWALALRGLLAIAAGVLFLIRPIESIVAIVLVLGVWIFVDGVISLVSAFSQRERPWSTAPIGAIGIIIGYLIFTRTGGATVVFYVLTAAWALSRGAAEISIASRMRRHEPGRGSLSFLGIVSFAFGIFLLVAPIAGAVTLGWWIGLYAIVYGVVSLIRSFQLRRVSPEVRAIWTARHARPRPA